PLLVLYRQVETAPVAPHPWFGDLPARWLNDAPDGRQVLVLEVPGGWTWQLPGEREQGTELLVLSGELAVGSESLGPLDYLQLPAGADAAPWRAAAAGARLLLFLDPPRPTDGTRPRIVHTAALPWVPGTVAQRDTGIRLPLEVKDLRWVESTGQRTWLLRMGEGFAFPWEVHETAEEGFLISGGFRLSECLADGPVHGRYDPGGYFYRPAGIPHGGPDSGTDGEALFLLRTPTRLTVEFLETCPRAAR
ncbi:MAG: hypothetical protein D6727_09100, partial [Gammaproteobacteria bacterium]